MATSIDEIQAEIIASKDNEPSLNGLNSPSQTAIWRLWTRIIATAHNLHEQIVDTKKEEIEQIGRDAISGTAEWLQKRVLEFQYSVSNPQVLTVVEGKASYYTVDPSLRIIARASVKEQASGKILVKVAKLDGSDLAPLSADERNALVSYLDKVAFAGIPVSVITLNSDKLRFEGKVIYNGENVGSVMKTKVIAAINDYLKSISTLNFSGTVVREQLIDYIQAVEGVVGIDTVNVKLNGREDSDALGGINNVDIIREYETFSGYITEEDTAGNTFDDLLTMESV